MTKEAHQKARERVKEQLSEYRHLRKEGAQIQRKLEEVEAAMMSPRTPRLDGMPRGGSGGDPVSSLVEQHLALIDKYTDLLTHQAKAQLDVERMIESLPSKERLVLRSYYIDGMTWEKVCVAANYSWRQVHNIHAAALDRLVEDMV